MYYEINIAKKFYVSLKGENMYQHYFATAPRSITTMLELKTIAKHFSKLFPEPEYKITLSRYEQTGYPLTLEELKEISE